MEDIIREINGFVWSQYFLIPLLLLTGVYLTFGLRLMSIIRLPYAIGQLFRKREDTEGDVSPFGALMTALSSTIGTGNIAGVAAAIAIGGPGAVFWMWMTAIVGMATKYSEGVLALKFRETDEDGRHVGGPMYYIKNGLGKSWIWLAVIFASFGVLAAWGTGASIQANSIADALNSNYGISPLITGGVLALAAGAVILGGITRIANVATKLVPLMAIGYLGAGLIVIFMHADAIPGAFNMIFTGAFGLSSAGTGISIGLMMLAMQKGVARGIFSNESGQGSAPIAHAAAKNTDPVNQGIVAMLGTVIDTLIVCTITALVILTSGIVGPECIPTAENAATFLMNGQPAGCDTAAPLTAAAFGSSLPGVGEHIVAVSLTIFAFTTILGWSYYGERCCEFLFGTKSIIPFRISWILVTFLGAAALVFEGEVANLVNLFWLVADTLTGLMAAPNLIALVLLSPLIFKLTKAYFANEEARKKIASGEHHE
ncbi:alanine/glycine:cation symporter family protein [Parvularcula marina]|uniref:Sodium:alanine symporter family protein n=1 Tax=Parvularcula marina TaxID=2292771 RepID=A0A371RJ74_9PROT|nr:sodium:alanine symporter family protein [Parvularcula marina]RFB05494.1 sodium:alanine symporter family protein [Parvularcula marina]